MARWRVVWPVGFWSALQFLTRIPVPGSHYRLEAGLVWFPVVGLLLGGILAALDLALRWLNVPPLVTSTILVVALLALSGALHADGLMDTCDAAFAHATPERRLEIMRDPRVGAFGVVGLVSIVALKIAALDALPAPARPGVLILAPALGRWSIVVLAGAFPYGRESGMGAALSAVATPRAIALGSIVPVLACLAVWPIGIALGILAMLTALLLGRWLNGLLPGLTGDTYGASCETVEAVVLVAAAPLAYALA